MKTSLVSASLDTVKCALLIPEFSGSYVSLALWTAAESSITVVISCLPSLRPLFARVIWARTHNAKIRPESSHINLASSWKNGKGQDSYDGGFNRLPEASSGSWGWPNRMAVTVHGGSRAEDEECEGDGGHSPQHTAHKGIMVKTTVVQEIHERLNYHDGLF